MGLPWYRVHIATRGY